MKRTIKNQNQVQVLKQVSEAFCDDVNLIVTSDEDLKVIGNAVIDFENASGAILSRNKKCLVLGLGTWKSKTSWILDYLQPVTEIKVFGIWFMNDYYKLLSTNWNKRIEKLKSTLFAWTGRVFSNLKQRIEVLNCFALSRIFYVGTMTKSASKTINSLVGEFIWKKSGRVLKIARDEVINSETRGGLGLLDTETMCNSLIVSQAFRLMKSSDLKSQGHLNFWLSDLLEEFWNGPVSCVANGNIESHHFNMLASLMTNVKLLESVDFAAWNRLTNKMIYQNFSALFTRTKIERDASCDMSSVWSRLIFLNYNRVVQEVSYLLVHNKLPVQERLFRIQLAKDPYCLACASASFQDVIHFFTLCDRTRKYWSWARSLALSLLKLRTVNDEDLILFKWPKSRRDQDICWLIGHYVFIIWDMLYTRRLTAINETEFFGFMRYKYKEALSNKTVSEIADLLL